MKLTLVRGLPGSGKSTYAKSLNVFHVEADMFCMRDGEYCYDGKSHRCNHELCFKMFKIAIDNRSDVVVSNTFTQLWEMDKYIDYATSVFASVDIVKMTGDYGTIHNVPSETISLMKQRWQDAEGEIFR